MTSLLKYKKPPKINDLLGIRDKHYNETLQYIDEQEKLGNAYVIRPSKSLPVGRMERKKERLEELYELGWSDAKKQCKMLKQFLMI